MVAAPPGIGKSIFALTQAQRTRIPTLYHSADSDAFTQMSRGLCIETGCTMREAEQAVARNEDLSALAPSIGEVPIRFEYDTTPDADSIEESADSYEELYGEYPEMMIVDNVTNVYSEAGDAESSSTGLHWVCDYLSSLAMTSNACIVGLHHVKSEWVNGASPIPMNGLMDQVHKVPRLILTLFSPSEGVIGVSKVKDRFGKADPSGKQYTELAFDGERMQIKDVQKTYDPWS